MNKISLHERAPNNEHLFFSQSSGQVILLTSVLDMKKLGAHLPNGTWDAMAEKFLSVCEKHDFLLVYESHILRKGTLRNQGSNMHFVLRIPKHLRRFTFCSCDVWSVVYGLTHSFHEENILLDLPAESSEVATSSCFPAQGHFEPEDTEEDIVGTPADGYFLQSTEEEKSEISKPDQILKKASRNNEAEMLRLYHRTIPPNKTSAQEWVQRVAELDVPLGRQRAYTILRRIKPNTVIGPTMYESEHLSSG